MLSIISILYSVEITESGVLFEYEDENAQSVFLVGSMNNWNTTATPMEKDENGIWGIILNLDSGKHTYKFVVDGNWHYDQENPNVEDDGYGGSNSVIEIDKNGKLMSQSIKNSDGNKSTFNPKIYFKGRYFANNIFLKNETDRFMLDKPEHDLNLGINIKFNSDFEGYTVLNVNNNEEGSEMWKTHFNYKRTYLKLKADYFNVTAFDNFGLFTFDDPLHIVGDIGYNGYDFGYDFSGIYAEASNLLSNKISNVLPVSMNGQLLFSDRIGYNEDDISAIRVKLLLPIFNDNNFTFGASNYRYTTKPSEEIIQYHRNNEVDFKYTKYFSKSGWEDAMQFEFSAEYSTYKNSDEDSVRSVWMEGENTFLGVSLQFPAALKFYANYLNYSFQLVETNASKNRFNLGVSYKLKNFSWNLSGQVWENYLPDSLNWVDYYKYVEKTDGNGRWFQQYSELPFEKYTVLGYQSGFFLQSDLSYKFKVKNHIAEMNLKNKFAQHALLTEPKFIENIVVLKYDIAEKWKLNIDTRIPYYNDPFLELITDFENDKDVFISNYSEISYHLSDNIWLALGYGVNPLIINSVTDEFYDRGREEYLDTVGALPEYLESYYGGFGEKIRAAETLLMNEKRISIQAVVKF